LSGLCALAPISRAEFLNSAAKHAGHSCLTGGRDGFHEVGVIEYIEGGAAQFETARLIHCTQGALLHANQIQLSNGGTRTIQHVRRSGRPIATIGRDQLLAQRPTRGVLVSLIVCADCIVVFSDFCEEVASKLNRGDVVGDKSQSLIDILEGTRIQGLSEETPGALKEEIRQSGIARDCRPKKIRSSPEIFGRLEA
jgi:hypothetical protein